MVAALYLTQTEASMEERNTVVAAIGAALAFLQERGVTANERSEPLGEHDTIASPEMILGRYEAGRPDEAQAFRHGDARVVADEGWRGPEDFDAEMERLVRTGGR